MYIRVQRPSALPSAARGTQLGKLTRDAWRSQCCQRRNLGGFDEMPNRPQRHVGAQGTSARSKSKSSLATAKRGASRKSQPPWRPGRSTRTPVRTTGLLVPVPGSRESPPSFTTGSPDAGLPARCLGAFRRAHGRPPGGSIDGPPAPRLPGEACLRLGRATSNCRCTWGLLNSIVLFVASLGPSHRRLAISYGARLN